MNFVFLYIDKEDMSREEFDLFLQALPQQYLQRQKSLNLTWKEFAGDDNVLDLDEWDPGKNVRYLG